MRWNCAGCYFAVAIKWRNVETLGLVATSCWSDEVFGVHYWWAKTHQQKIPAGSLDLNFGCLFDARHHWARHWQPHDSSAFFWRGMKELQYKAITLWFCQQTKMSPCYRVIPRRELICRSGESLERFDEVCNWSESRVAFRLRMAMWFSTSSICR